MAQEKRITTGVLVQNTTLSMGKKESVPQFLKRFTHVKIPGTESRKVHVIENLEQCPNIKVLYLYDNAIHKIENLDFATNLTHLYLQNNNLTGLDNLHCLVKLQKLCVDGNKIQHIQGLESCLELQELHLSNQKIDEPMTFDIQSLAISSLRILHASNCNIHDCSPFRVMRNVEILRLEKNSVTELEAVQDLTRELRRLRELDLSDNPFCSTPKYYEQVMLFSQRTLELFNKRTIDPRQRMMMQTHAAHKYRLQGTKKTTTNQPEEPQGIARNRKKVGSRLKGNAQPAFVPGPIKEGNPFSVNGSTLSRY